MSLTRSLFLLASVLVVASSVASTQTRGGLMGDLMADVTEVEGKVVSLARAMPESAYAWRPGKGVRSVGEAFTHVAADNYFMPAALGTAAPAGTGISGTDYKTVESYESRTRSRAEIIAELEASFAFLKKAMQGTTDARLETSVKMFGRESSVRSTWVGTTTHLHEHLGQLIAYARTNNVVPPWSQ